MSKKVLGTGLSALIGDLDVGELMTRNTGDKHKQSADFVGEMTQQSPAIDKRNIVKHVPLMSVVSGKYQPRTVFNEQELADLAASITKNGIIQPILVRQIGINYEIVAGERRWRAAKIAGLDSVPVLIKDLSDQETLEVALIENIQRQDLNIIEEAEGFRRLLDEFNYTQETISQALGKSRSHIANLLRLLSLPSEVKEMLSAGILSMGHARALINVENSTEIANTIAEKSLSVRDTEKLIRAMSKPASKARSFDFSQKSNKDQDLESIENSLTAALGLKVKIEDSRQGGVVSVEFHNLEQLDTIIQVLSGGKSGF